MAALIQQRGYRVHLLPIVDKESSPLACSYYSHWLGASQELDSRQTLDALAAHDSVDWMVIDHYAIDAEWEKAIRPSVGNIMVIDCLANRYHDCDLLLDQNLYTSGEDRHRAWVPDSCRALVGPQYAVLRPEFAQARATLRHRDGRVRRILIQFGGVDATNETSKVLDAIESLKRPALGIDVVIAGTNLHRAAIEEQCRELPSATFHCQTKQVARLMAAADLAIGAGGTTVWERCSLGLPSLIVAVAENQKAATEALDDLGAAWNLGAHTEVGVEEIKNSIKSVLEDPQRLLDMERRCKTIMVGNRPVGSQTDVAGVLKTFKREYVAVE